MLSLELILFIHTVNPILFKTLPPHLKVNKINIKIDGSGPITCYCVRGKTCMCVRACSL